MKIDNEMLRELFALEQEVRKKQKRISEIKDLCRLKGSFATKEFVCSVSEVSREIIGPTQKVLQVFGREALEKAELIYTSKFVTIRTTKKDIVPDLDL